MSSPTVTSALIQDSRNFPFVDHECGEALFNILNIRLALGLVGAIVDPRWNAKMVFWLGHGIVATECLCIHFARKYVPDD